MTQKTQTLLAAIRRSAIPAICTKTFVALSLTTGLLLGSNIQSASAYCYTGQKWANSAVNPWISISVPSGWVTDLTNSGNTWNGIPGSAFNLAVGHYGEFGPPWNGGWLLYLPTGSVTIPASTQSSATLGAASMTWANTTFDSSWSWAGSMNQATKTADVRTVATHELGHWGRLLHPSDCGPMTSAETNSVMHPNWTVKLFPNSDDKAAMAAVY